MQAPESLILCLIIILTPMKVVLCGGPADIYFKLISFENPSGKDASGSPCDGAPGFKLHPTSCDPYFKICMNPNPIPQIGKCRYGIITTPTDAFQDQNNVHFGSKIDFLKNPLVFSTTNFVNSIHMNVRVMDADDIFNEDDLIDTISGLVSGIPVYLADETPNKGHQMMLTARTVLKVEIWAVCGAGYYGPDCATRCFPQASDLGGYYGCSRETGEKVCLPGWRGASCNQRNYCQPTNPCKNNGKCVNTESSFVCICPIYLAGLLCENIVHPCTTNPCANGAVCSISGETICHCAPGWSGKFCRVDVDECLKHPCVNNAVCKNTPGSFQCSCRRGFRGTTCSEKGAVDMPNIARIVTDPTTGKHAGNLPGRMQDWAIVVIVVCCCASIIVIAVVLFVIIRTHRKHSHMQAVHHPAPKPVRYVPGTCTHAEESEESAYDDIDEQVYSSAEMPEFSNPIYLTGSPPKLPERMVSGTEYDV